MFGRIFVGIVDIVLIVLIAIAFIWMFDLVIDPLVINPFGYEINPVYPWILSFIVYLAYCYAYQTSYAGRMQGLRFIGLDGEDIGLIGVALRCCIIAFIVIMSLFIKYFLPFKSEEMIKTMVTGYRGMIAIAVFTTYFLTKRGLTLYDILSYSCVVKDSPERLKQNNNFMKKFLRAFGYYSFAVFFFNLMIVAFIYHATP